MRVGSSLITMCLSARTAICLIAALGVGLVGAGCGDPDRTPSVPEPQAQGDEEEIRSEAVFTGRGGRLTPREVRVPAFIAVRVILRGADASRAQGYSLTIGGTRLFVGHTRKVDDAKLDGLLPGRSYRGRSPQGNVRIVASAEPGP